MKFVKLGLITVLDTQKGKMVRFTHQRRSFFSHVFQGQCTCLFLLILCSFSEVFSQKPKGHSLILVSIDGFRWDYLNRTQTPNFDRVIKEGVYATRGLQNVFITNTLPNHWSMVTGLYAESHGIVENQMYDPVLNETLVPLYIDRKAINNPRFYDVPGVEPIWALNQLQKNGRSGSIMWWGAEYAVNYVRPTYHMAYDRHRDDFLKIDTMIKWFTSDYPINLGLFYCPEPDGVAHKYGVESDNVTQAIVHADDLTGYLIKQLENNDLLDDTNIIITSDHGFVSTPKNRTIPLDDFVDPSWYRFIHDTPLCSIIPKPGYEDRVYERLKSAAPTNHFRVFKKEEIPDEYHYKHNARVTPIVALADLSYNFIVNMSKEDFVLEGNHGYANTYQEMRPFFMAMGPSFKSGYQLETFKTIDIYELMSHLLNVKPGPNNGSLSDVSKLLKDENEANHSTHPEYAVFLIVIACVWVRSVVGTSY